MEIDGTSWYLVALVQYGTVVFGTWWKRFSIGQHWLVLGGTGGLYLLIADGTGYRTVMPLYNEKSGDLVGCHQTDP